MNVSNFNAGLSMPYQQPILFGRKVDNNQPNQQAGDSKPQADSFKPSDSKPKIEFASKTSKYSAFVGLLFFALTIGMFHKQETLNKRPISQAQLSLIQPSIVVERTLLESDSTMVSSEKLSQTFRQYLDSVSSTIAQTNNPEAALKAEMENLPLEKVESEKVLKFYRNAVKSGATNNPEACLNQFIDEFLADRMNPQTIQQIKAEVKKYSAEIQKLNADQKTRDKLFHLSALLAVMAFVITILAEGKKKTPSSP